MTGKYINIGCGFSVGDSWENYDKSPTLRIERIPLLGRIYTKNDRRFPSNVRYGDIVKKPLCHANEADAVFCSHMLEHLSLDDMRLALTNIHTMLKPGGVFRLIVPDFAAYIEAYTVSDNTEKADEFIKNTELGVVNTPKSFLARFLKLFSSSQHLWMYDEASLFQKLSNVGFVNIRRCDYGDSHLSVFSEVEDKSRFRNKYNIRELAIECFK